MNNSNQMKSYEDIIHLPHPTSKKHPRMAPIARAAQFAPFAALSGHSEAIYETERQVESRPILSEDWLLELNRKIAWLQEHISEMPEVKVKYFVPDPKKDGGAYVEKSGVVRKIDEYTKTLVFTDNTFILMENLLEMFFH